MAHGGEDPNGAKRTDLYRTIRSFCISAAHNFMTVDDLRRDYRELLGEDIERVVREVGYQNLEECLEHIDGEVVLLTYDQHRKTTMLKAVTSAETKHLEQLIVKQKVRQKLSRFNVKGVSAAPNPSSHSSSRTQATHNRAKGAKSGRINTLPTQRSSEAHMNAMQRFSHSNYLQPAKQKQVDTVTRIPSSFTNLPSTKPTKTSVTVSVDGGIRNVSLAQQAAAGNSISQWPKSVGTGSWSPLQSSAGSTKNTEESELFDYLVDEEEDNIERLKLWPSQTSLPKNVKIPNEIRLRIAVVLIRNPEGLNQHKLNQLFTNEFGFGIHAGRDCNCSYIDLLRLLDGDILELRPNIQGQPPTIFPSRKLLELAKSMSNSPDKEPVGETYEVPELTVKEFFREADQLLLAYPHGLTVFDFDEIYKQSFCRAVPLDLLDCFDTTEVIERNPDKFALVRVSPKVSHIFHPSYAPTSLQTHRSPAPPGGNDLCSSPVNSIAASQKQSGVLLSEKSDFDQLHQIISCHFPEGIKIDLIRETFLAHTGRLFPKSESPVALAQMLADFEIFLCDYNTEEHCLYIKAVPKFEDTDSYLDLNNLTIDVPNENSGATAVNPTEGVLNLWDSYKDIQFNEAGNKAIFFPQVSNYHIPKDICTPGTSTTWESPRKMENASDGHIEVYVGHVSSPGHFFVYLGSSSTHLNQLLCLMQDFYNYAENQAAYMPPVLCLLVSNLPIAALWEGNWQRALILQTDFVQQMCDVMFVDCGVCTRVAAKNVRFLPSRFVKLPFQNLHCRIANVIPAVGNNWSADTTMQFCMLTIGNLLRAKVVKIDGEFAPRRGYILPNGSLSVELFFVNANDEPQSVGESLVTSGFAAKVRISCPPPPGFCGPTEFEMNNELAVIADELDHIALPEETETLPAIPMSETSLTPDLRNLLQSILEGMAQGLLRVEEVEFGLKLLEKKGQELMGEIRNGRNTPDLRSKIHLNQIRVLCFKIAVHRYKTGMLEMPFVQT